MSFFEKHKIKIIFSAIAVVALALTFVLEGNISKPSSTDTVVTATAKPKTKKTRKAKATPTPTPTPDVMSEPTDTPEPDVEYSIEQGMELDETGHDEYQTEPVPVGQPVPVEPQSVEVTDKKMTCTLSISCASILNNMSKLKKGKESLIPSDGIIMPPQTVTFNEGESVYNVLLRETKRNGIHMDHQDTPAFNTSYIRAINNIYEFDCGDLSGWRYKVNGQMINYGCSRYMLHDGDVIEWVYTCDMGEDI